MYKLYMYINKINGKKYIGITKQTLKKRAGKNGNKYYGCILFGNAIKKYGWENFKSFILYEGLTYEEACEKEKKLIKFYDTTNIEKGYNLHKGGQGPSKESLEKMKNSHKSKKLSDEHKLEFLKIDNNNNNNIE